MSIKPILIFSCANAGAHETTSHASASQYFTGNLRSNFVKKTKWQSAQGWLPMEKPSTEVSSPDFLFRGKASSTRSGPKGDIQRTPAPTDLLRSLKLKPLVKALPRSKNATPRTPYCSRIGNSSSVFITTAASPPTTSVPWHLTVGGLSSLLVTQE